VLNMQNLEDKLFLQEKQAKSSEKDWDKMKRMTCSVIRSCLTQDLKYRVMNETSTKKIWEIFKSKYLTKSIENQLHLKMRLYRFQLKKRISIGKHMNNFTKVLTNLTWMR